MSVTVLLRVCKLGLVLYCIIFILCGTVYANDTAYGDIYGVEYISNYDGDTVKVNIPHVHPLIGDGINIRLYGIDTPEIRSHCYKEKRLAYEAKYAVARMLSKAHYISLVNVRRGKYFRIVADIVADGKSVSRMLLNKHLAVPYFGGKKEHDWCE